LPFGNRRLWLFAFYFYIAADTIDVGRSRSGRLPVRLAGWNFSCRWPAWDISYF